MEFASRGEDVYVAPNVVWKRPHLAYLRSHIAIDDYFYCTTRIFIENNVHIGPHVSIIGGEHSTLYVGRFCTISAGARIICKSDSFDGSGLVTVPDIPDEFKNTVLGEKIVMHNFSAVGTNAVLMPDVVLAEGVVVGANSLVTETIFEPWTIWVGSPAQKLKDRPREKIQRIYEQLLEK